MISSLTHLKHLHLRLAQLLLPREARAAVLLGEGGAPGAPAAHNGAWGHAPLPHPRGNPVVGSGEACKSWLTAGHHKAPMGCCMHGATRHADKQSRPRPPHCSTALQQPIATRPCTPEQHAAPGPGVAQHSGHLPVIWLAPHARWALHREEGGPLARCSPAAVIPLARLAMRHTSNSCHVHAPRLATRPSNNHTALACQPAAPP